MRRIYRPVFLCLILSVLNGFGQSPAATKTQSAKQQSVRDKAAARVAPTAPQAVAVEAWKMLAQGAASDKVVRRTDAISAAATIGPLPEVLSVLKTALSDKEPDVRQVAATSCGEIKSRSLIPVLDRALNDDSPEVSFAAAKALWEMGDHRGRDIFLAVLAGERTPSKISNELADAKRRLRNPMALAIIGANEGAGALLGPFSIGISIAEELAKDNSAQARALSATLLGADTSPETVEQLEKALADKNWVVRAAAAKALGNRSQLRIISKLQPLLKDDKEPVRFMAAASIVRLSKLPATRWRRRLERRSTSRRVR